MMRDHEWLADVGTSVDGTDTTTECEEFMHEESKERERMPSG